MILGIRYLTGYCVASDLTRQQAEWPPHVARVFMAMAAAHFETGADPAEREALLWLETQQPPQVFAGVGYPRSAVETYVPVNDTHGGILNRPRQSRRFPSVRPDHDSVFLYWNDQPAEKLRAALGQLCGKVTRVGHSSSLTQMWIAEDGGAPKANWKPDDSTPSQLFRVPQQGLLEYLEQSFNGNAIEEFSQLTSELLAAKGKAKAALKSQLQERFGDQAPQAAKPLINCWRGYRLLDPLEEHKQDPPLSGPFEPAFIVLDRYEGPALGLESTLQLTLALRNALLSVCPEPQPEWLSGHAADGTPSKHPHVAFFPLPFVGAPHADGHVMGLGIAIPKHLANERRSPAQALRESVGPLFFDPATRKPREIKLWKKYETGDQTAWLWEIRRELREDPPLSLKTSTWTGPASRWASVTPVVLHHYPRKGDATDVERILRDAFKSALLPDPESIEISPSSAHAGAGSMRDVPAFIDSEGHAKYATHVVATFSQWVTGPMLVGRGRFRGYGLFRPLPKDVKT